jgi:asparagine synthase (glutamine-hydrolysing)
MCGITGIFHLEGRRPVEEATLTGMRETMLHRGPDGGSSWISPDGQIGLAHRRLSIIDLSDIASQPMCNEDQSVWVTFNGEIYNHRVLRQELVAKGHLFRTDHSDTEVLVHGYEQWGIGGLVKRLDGDYAFAIWDVNHSRLSIARDPIGVKPVYFSFRDDVFLFASEIKAILAHPAVRADIDPAAMYHYLSFLTTPAPMTMFQGIFKLPAGHYVEVSKGGRFHAQRYWDAVPGQGIDPSDTSRLSERAREDFYVQGIRDRLRTAIEKRMMSDVPFGVFLSGGIDSSTNVALMSEFTEAPINTFTVGFKDYQHLNELDHAEAIAKRFSTNHHAVLIDESDMVGYLQDLVHHQDEPIADWVCIPLYFVSKLTRENGVTVVQVGEGSDEQFAGYASYMGYLRLYHRYWTPFRTYLPSIAQKGIASLFGAAARIKPGLDVYADIVDRATRDREHFWSGATVFLETIKHRLLRIDSLDVENTVPKGLLASGLLPDTYLKFDTYNVRCLNTDDL